MSQSLGLNVILTDINYVENIFPTAAAYRKLRDQEKPCLILPATPDIVGSDALLEAEIKQELANIRYDDGFFDEDDEGDDAGDIGETLPEPISFFIINLGPRRNGDVDHLISFIDRHAAKIVWWVDCIHDWLPQEVRYANHDREIVRNRRDKSALEILEALKFPSPLSWKKAEGAIISGEAEKIENSLLAVRFIDAFFVGKTISINIDDRYYLHNCFLSMLNELIRHRTEPLVDTLLGNFLNCFYGSEKAKGQISRTSPFFRQARKMGRTVGCLNLGAVPTYTNLEKILAEGEKAYPWLFVLRYRFNDRPRMYVSSKILDIRNIMSYYADTPHDYRTMMKMLNAEVVNWQLKQPVKSG